MCDCLVYRKNEEMKLLGFLRAASGLVKSLSRRVFLADLRTRKPSVEHVEIVDAEDSQFVPLSIMERTGWLMKNSGRWWMNQTKWVI